MSYIKEGDLLVDKATGTKYIATGADYTKRIPGTGEFLDDWSFEGAVNTIHPETGHRGWVLLRFVTKISDE